MNPLPVLAMIMLLPGLVGDFSFSPSPNIMLPEDDPALDNQKKAAGEFASWVWDQVITGPFNKFIDDVDNLDDDSVIKQIIEAVVDYVVNLISGVLNSVLGAINQVSIRIDGFWSEWAREKTSDQGVAMATFNLVSTVFLVLAWVIIIRLLVDAWSIVNWIIPT